ncbi:MAG TPA: ATP-binding protein [Micromonosporaceae bacterium]
MTSDGQTPTDRAGPRLPPGGAALDQPFDARTLVALRATVAAHADALGLGPLRGTDLVLIAHELASNAIRHAGGGGRLRMWRADEHVYCQVVDTGPGLPDPAAAGLADPEPQAAGGRGLWIVRQLADVIDVSTAAGGTTITVGLRLHRSTSDRAAPC